VPTFLSDETLGNLRASSFHWVDSNLPTRCFDGIFSKKNFLFTLESSHNLVKKIKKVIKRGFHAQGFYFNIRSVETVEYGQWPDNRVKG